MKGLDARCLGDPTRANAPGADLDVLRPTVNQGAHALQVRQPAPFGDVVSVGDVAARHRALAADFASLRHVGRPPRGPLTGALLNTTSRSEIQAGSFEEVANRRHVSPQSTPVFRKETENFRPESGRGCGRISRSTTRKPRSNSRIQRGLEFSFINPKELARFKVGRALSLPRVGLLICRCDLDS